jgi:hypothetical protein
MPDAPISCPFCNTLVPPTNSSSSSRILCPRCGDSFPVRESTALSVPNSNLLDDEVQRHRMARQAKAVHSIKTTLIAGVCLGALGLLVGIAISYFRTEPTDQPPAPAEAARCVPPLEMVALAYLPAGTDSVVALQLRPLLDSPRNAEKGARPALAQLGIPPGLVDAVERAVAGIGFDNIDQIVIGLTLKDGVLAQQPVLVIHTRLEFSVDKLTQIENARSERRGTRTYHRFPISAFVVDWWAPNDRFLVAALQADCLDAIPDGGFANHEQMSPRIRALVSNLLTADTICWAVLDSDKWDALGKLALSFVQKRDGELEKAADSLALLQSVVLGIRLEDEPILIAWFDLKSEANGADLRNLLLARFRDEQGKFLVGGAGNRVMVRTAIANATAAFQKAIHDSVPAK